jgi:hypothetical protein
MAQQGSRGAFQVGELIIGGVRYIVRAGAPTSGTGGAVYRAAPGSLYINKTNGAVYVNTNTKASPTWGALGTVTALAEGNIFIGDSGGAAAALSAKTSGRILVGNGTTVVSVAVSGDATLASTGALTIGASKLDGTQAKVAADVNVIGALPVIHRVMATALTGDVTVVLTHKTRILDVWAMAVGAGGAGDTITVKNVATAITNALDLNVGDKVSVRAGTFDTAACEISAGANLVISGASGVNAQVYILGVRV